MQDLNSIIQLTASTVGKEFVEDAASAAEHIQRALLANKASLSEIMQAKQNGEITDAEFEYELEGEMKVFETEMLAAKVISKVAVARITNATFACLRKLVNPLG